MAKHLLPAGYDILTVDIQWYEPSAKGHIYRPGAKLEMDRYGRLLPAIKKFPSSSGGQGFRLLADYVHSKGLRFAIHIMRGIPRQAVRQNSAILGSELRATDIADTKSTCSWNPDMYGVDMSKPGAQAYYDSLFKLYASWGVDYVKVDDISRPYDTVQQAEIEAIRRAIDKTGRPIVLSLSPGATPLEAGDHVARHANLWRITDDFWDRWGLLHAMFERLHEWTPYRRSGAWPDADMIPLGIVEFDRPTKFTSDEQQTLMTLWSIARSPLIFGGDMTRLDEATLALLTNPDVIEINQNSTNNRQVSREKDLVVWAADAIDSDTRYLALFNAQSREQAIDFDAATYTSPVISGKGNSVEISLPIDADQKLLVLFVRDGGDGIFYDHAVWAEPTLHGPKGKLSLTELKWTHATVGWGEPRVNRTCDNKELKVSGKRVTGIGVHADSTLIYSIPSGYETFTTNGVLTEDGSIELGVLLSGEKPELDEETSQVAIALSKLAIESRVRIRDIWSGKDLGEFKGEFSKELPYHGSGFYKLTPVK